MKNVICSVLMSVVSSSSLLAQPTLVATPSSGELGSIIQLSVVPQTPGFELTPETTGVWFGSYSSTAGTSSLFTTSYGGTTISIIDDWTAEILLGTGHHVSKTGQIEFADLSSLAPNGTLNGAFQLITPNPCRADLDGNGFLDFFDVGDFLDAYANEDPVADFTGDGIFDFFDVGDFLVSFSQGCGPIAVITEGPVSMGFTVEPAKWHHIHYPGGWTSGVAVELLDEEPGDLSVFRASGLPALPQDDSILGASGLIYAIVLDVESNAVTDGGSPATIEVDIFTVDDMGNEIDRIVGLPLANIGAAGGRVRYSSLALKNVMLTDIFVDDTPYSNLHTLMSADNGQAYIVLSIGE